MLAFVASLPRLDYVGTVATLTSDWRRWQRACGVVGWGRRVPAFDAAAHYHASSSDPLGTYAAARRAVAGDPAFARALCHVVAVDYACWSLVPPPGCEDVVGGGEGAW